MSVLSLSDILERAQTPDVLGRRSERMTTKNEEAFVFNRPLPSHHTGVLFVFMLIASDPR